MIFQCSKRFHFQDEYYIRFEMVEIENSNFKMSLRKRQFQNDFTFVYFEFLKREIELYQL